MSSNSSRTRPANGSRRRGSTPCRRRLSAGRKLDASLRKDVIAGLPPRYRCVAPTLPPGPHRRVMKPSADLSLPGVTRLVGEFLDRLGPADVTLVGNDSRGAITQMLISGGAPRVGPVVPASCETFGNFPPGLIGRTLALAGKLPPTVFGLVIQQMRVRPLRPLPNAFGWLTKRGDAATAWNQSQRSIRRNTVRMLRAVFAGKDLLRRAAERLPGFGEPALIVWAKGNPVMPPEHGRRLAGLLQQAQLTEIDDSSALSRSTSRPGPPSSSPTSPAHRAAPRGHTRSSPGHEHTYSRITRRPRLPRRAGHRRATQPCPPASKTRRFSGWLSWGGYLPLIWQPADAHRST